MPRFAPRLIFAAMLFAMISSCVCAPRAGAGTVEVLGYEPISRMLYWVERPSDARDPMRVMRRDISYRASQAESVGVFGGRSKKSRAIDPISLLPSRLIRPVPGPSDSVALDIRMDSLFSSGRWRGSSVAHVSARDANRSGERSFPVCTHARVGIAGLVRIPDEQCEVAIVSFAGPHAGHCKPMEVPLMLFGATTPRVPTAPPAPLPDSGFATLVGRACTQEGWPLAYATLFVVGTRLGTTVDRDGWFIVRNVPLGPCRVKLMAMGFDPVIVTDTLVAGVNPPLHMNTPREPERVVEIYPGLPCMPYFWELYTSDLHRVGAPDTGYTRPARVRSPGTLDGSCSEAGCSISLTWEPQGKPRRTRIVILDARKSIVHDFGFVPPGARWSGTWDGRDSQGQTCWTGHYVVEARAGRKTVRLLCPRWRL